MTTFWASFQNHLQRSSHDVFYILGLLLAVFLSTTSRTFRRGASVFSAPGLPAADHAPDCGCDCWRWIYQPDWGLSTGVGRGRVGDIPKQVGERDTAHVVMDVGSGSSSATRCHLHAALQRVDPQLYEAASLAGELDRRSCAYDFHVRPEIFVVILTPRFTP
jgi:ABC-type sugar transport system permease subunit